FHPSRVFPLNKGVQLSVDAGLHAAKTRLTTSAPNRARDVFVVCTSIILILVDTLQTDRVVYSSKTLSFVSLIINDFAFNYTIFYSRGIDLGFFFYENDVVNGLWQQ